MTARLRLAPTPSGYLHQGNFYNFLLTDGLCQRLGGHLRLRIDNSDSGRTRQAYVDHIFDCLLALGIAWHHGPATATDYANQHQQHQAHHHVQLNRLVQTGLVYACHCTRAQLSSAGHHAGCGCLSHRFALHGAGAAWRIQVPAQAVVAFFDLALGPQRLALASGMGNFVIRKKDRQPAYQLASFADDLHHGTTHIVRGADLLPSTAAQCYLAAVLGEKQFLDMQYLHHPLITNPLGEKLSKSAGHGAAAVHSPQQVATLKTELLQQIEPLLTKALERAAPSGKVLVLI
jgi:glutamyl/glutaminyl-tRNA synthetase